MTGPTRATGRMTVLTDTLQFDTQGNTDVVKLTTMINDFLSQSGLDGGSLTVFVPGATGAVTTLEFEPGVVQDFTQLFDRLIPKTRHYEHNVAHLDHNGHSHVRAGLLGPSLVLPFTADGLSLGTWQDVCFLCFDNEPRRRTVFVQALGVDTSSPDTATD